MLISVLMPTYNGLRHVREAVESVLCQQGCDWELIIADDGSTDGTRDYLSTVQDPRVRVIFNPRNLGIFGNLNMLFGQARGEVTQIFCQDDWLLGPDALRRLADLWASLPAEVAFVRANHSRDANSALSRMEARVLPSHVRPEQSDLFFLIFGCIPGNLSNVSIRTHLVSQCGGFNPKLPYAGDFEFWARVGRQHPWVISDLHIACVRVHPGQASFHLNLKGELLPQLQQVLDVLYANLLRRGHDAARLKVMVSLNYVALHRHAGLKKLLRQGDGHYLALVRRHFEQATFAVHPAWGWPLFVVSAGGRLFKLRCARALLRRGAELAPAQ